MNRSIGYWTGFYALGMTFYEMPIVMLAAKNQVSKAAIFYIKNCQDFLMQNNSETGTLVETFDARIESSDTNTLLL
ncbi:MAG TPA: hypothetical protein V6D11_03120 [Waterburya sp.]|jgi:hypothetical protein